MNGSELFEILSEVDEELINRAQDRMERRPTVLQRMRRMPWYLRAASLAAAVAIVIASFFGIRYLSIISSFQSELSLIDSTEKDDRPLFSFGAQKPSAPPLPWEETLHIKLHTETSSFKPTEAVELFLEIGLNDGFLGDGDLVLTINAADFDVDLPGGNTLTLKDFTLDTYPADSPKRYKIALTPHIPDGIGAGNVSISLSFIPDDFDALRDTLANSSLPSYNDRWEETFLSDGTLAIRSVGFVYVADPIELRIAPPNRSTGDLMSKLLSDHYKTGRLSGRELASLYYAYEYRDMVFASVTSYIEAERSFRFEYKSKSIRYACNEYIQDDEIYSLAMEINDFMFHSDSWEDTPEITEKRYTLARLILKKMLHIGVINEQEYEAELALIDSVSYVGNFDIAYSSESASIIRILRKYRYTHE